MPVKTSCTICFSGFGNKLIVGCRMAKDTIKTHDEVKNFLWRGVLTNHSEDVNKIRSQKSVVRNQKEEVVLPPSSVNCQPSSKLKRAAGKRPCYLCREAVSC